MKKIIGILSLFILTINFAACTANKNNEENIHSKIHDKYYSMKSYTTECTVTAYTPGGENTYDCKVGYDSADNSFIVTSDDMTINLTNDKTIIKKGETEIETAASQTDMYIFVNTFFKSYYEAEDTCVNVSTEDPRQTTLLECSAINPTEFTSSMKLWVDNKSVLPVKMQVFDKEGVLNAEINFQNFEFI